MQGAAIEAKLLDSAVSKLDGRLSTMGKAVAGYFAFSTIKDFSGQIIDSLKNYESFSASLRTLMYGDKETAKALENQLISLAAKTPFSLVDVQQGTKQLLAYGFQAGQITKTLTTLGDISSGVGAPLTDIVYLYGTLRTQGRAYTKDIMQFTGRGIPIIRELAKQFGVTEDKVQGLVEAGKVGFPQIERAFSDMTRQGGQFFGMMSEQSKTVGGQLSNLGDAWEQLKVNIGKSQTRIINSTISWANNMVSNFNRAISALNDIEQAFTKSGAAKFSFKERADDFAYTFLQNISFGKLGLQSAMDYYREYQTALSDQISRSKTKGELLGAKAGLLLQRNELRRQRFTDKTLNETGFERMMSITDVALSRVEGSLKLLSVKPQLTESALKSDVTKSGGSTVGSSVDVYGNRPQNINITLDRLGDVIINGTTMKEDAKEVKEIWSKQLLEVLNDANLMAR